MWCPQHTGHPNNVLKNNWKKAASGFLDILASLGTKLLQPWFNQVFSKDIREYEDGKYAEIWVDEFDV